MKRPFMVWAALAAAMAGGCTPGGGCAAGGGRDAGPGDVVWSAPCRGLDDYVLSVWGPGPDDIFFVGGNGVAARALLLHYDGASWVRTTGVSDQVLWWVWGTSGQDVWAVGENGQALHFDGGLWTRTSTGTTATLYGVWGSAADAVWAVGGSIDPLGPKDVFLYWDGMQWLPTPTDGLSGESIFKVWGASPTDVWAVGTGGVLYHWTGGPAWVRVPSPTDDSLISLYGNAADDIYAVGGITDGVLLHYDGTAWAVIASGFSTAGLNGVWTAPAFSTILVGHDGYAARFRDGAAEPLPTGVSQGLHAVFVDGGGTWAVGGNLLDSSSGPGGVILRFGTPAAACDIVDFMQPPTGGTDGGVADPCPGGTGSVGPGGECGSGRDCQCMAGLECWYVVIETSQVNNHFICTAPCTNAAQCQLAYGAGACCIIPGPQTVTSVCHSPGYDPPAGDPCN
ncbi:MAG TPA: hypothetical protein VG389_20535 [Myxococcota bacterium]|jgi:hypothetical protein|nr:hypothetical protein [Myxococcota bacterium]